MGRSGRAGIVFDLTDVLAPQIDLAFETPAPGSPVGLIFPIGKTPVKRLRSMLDRDRRVPDPVEDPSPPRLSPTDSFDRAAERCRALSRREIAVSFSGYPVLRHREY